MNRIHPLLSSRYVLKQPLLSASVAALVMWSSCSDDHRLASPGSDGDKVWFEVEVGDGFKHEAIPGGRASTRVDGKSLSPDDEYALPLREGDRPFYLVAETREGIDVKKETGETTRSSLVSRDDIQGFGVFASIKPSSATSIANLSPDYMWNVEVARGNDWTPVDNYLWPGTGALHFNAYSPFVGDMDGEAGVTSLPMATDKGELYLNYSTPLDVADQEDLLISEPTDVNSSPCNLIFNHALTAIRFATGPEMAPSTIKSVTLSGICSKGRLNMETGEWSELEDAVEFSVARDVVLAAAEGSDFVAPDTFITSEEETFLLIPQQLGEDAKITIELEEYGVTTTLDAPLNGVAWEAGKTVTYKISANPKLGSFMLGFTDAEGDAIGGITTPYTGETINFRVKSSYGSATDETARKEIAWKAEFVDADGNPAEKPQWLSKLTMSGTGSADLSLATAMQTPVFEAVSGESAELRAAADVNETSGYRPFNLANPTGQASVQNTANCYLVHAPGFYGIPLVYGNAIKGGKTNTSAYMATNTSNIHVLKNMVNHTGEAITDPYIYNNAGCVPEDAVLVWESRLNLMQKVQLSPDKKRLIFVVSPDYICQGNAIVAVRNAEGVVLWSWHVWVTPYRPENDEVTINYHGIDYHMMTRNLGHISPGDHFTFKERTAYVKFTQLPSDGSEGETVILPITQRGKVVTTPSSYNYYQWGRKDPMISDVTEWYTSDYSEVTKIWTKNFTTDRTPGLPIIADYIRTPGYFWVSPHTAEVFPYYNLWNTNFSTTAEVKTIYDPSPAGYMVSRNMLTALQNAPAQAVDGADGIGLNITVPGTDKVVFFPAHGYRSSEDGSIQGRENGNEVGSVWTSRTTSTTKATVLVMTMTSDIIQVQGEEERAMGFGVRPAKEL